MAGDFVFPESEKDSFLALIALEDEEFAAIESEIEAQSARLSLTPLSRAFMRAEVKSRLKRMPRLLLSLRVAIDREGAQVQKVVRQLGKSGLELRVITPEQRTVLESRLNRLLSVRYLRILAKALELGTVAANATGEVRIVTDIRPIFLDEPDAPDAIAQSVLLHTLRLESAHDEAVVYATMDTQTLRELKQAIERALRKEDAIRRVLPDAVSPVDLMETSE